MELAAWIAGEPHSAFPTNASPLLASMVQGLNDAFEDADRQRLIDYALPLAHSRAGWAIERKRARLAERWLRDEYPEFCHGGFKESMIALAVALAVGGKRCERVTERLLASLEADVLALSPTVDAIRDLRPPASGSRRIEDSVLCLLDRMLVAGSAKHLPPADGEAGVVAFIG